MTITLANLSRFL